MVLTSAVSRVLPREVYLRADDVADALEDESQGHGDDFFGVTRCIQVGPPKAGLAPSQRFCANTYEYING